MSRQLPRIREPKDIALVAENMGAPFCHVTDPNQVHALRQPHVMCLVTSMAFQKLKSVEQINELFDAAVLYKNRVLGIHWNHQTVLALERSFKDLENDITCSICMEDARFGATNHCRDCGYPTCLRCMFKMMADFDDNGVLKNVRDGWVHVDCPQCKLDMPVDPMCTYFTHLDELNQFSENQQAYLLHLKEQDTDSKRKLRAWKEHLRIKKGSQVRVHGLVKREDLNGKVGMISGDSKQTNEVMRWPVVLDDDQINKTILVKPENLNPEVNTLTILQIGGSTPDFSCIES